MIVLGVETSCDETGIGIVRGHDLLANQVASSVDLHARFGGVVPEVAPPASCEGPALASGNRCAKVTKSMGNEASIDDFEPGPNHTATCDKIREVDALLRESHGAREAAPEPASEAGA